MMKVHCFNQNMLQENTYVLVDSDTGAGVVIDPGCYTPAMKTLLQSLTALPYIILTHGHGDHIAAIDELKADYPDAKVVAGEKEAALLADAANNGSMQFAPKPVAITADLQVKEDSVLPFGTSEFRFLETPGHTAGGICILVDDLMFSGDTLFYRSIGRTDFATGSPAQMMASLKRLMTLPEDTIVYPGHGIRTTIGEEKRGNPFV